MREGLIPKKDEKCQVPKPLPFTFKGPDNGFLDMTPKAQGIKGQKRNQTSSNQKLL